MLNHLSGGFAEVAIEIGVLVDFDVNLLGLGNLLTTEPVGCLAKRVVVYQVLHVDILLFAVGKGAHSSSAAGEFVVCGEVALQAFVARRRRAAGREHRVVNEALAEQTLQGRWQLGLGLLGFVFVFVVRLVSQFLDFVDFALLEQGLKHLVRVFLPLARVGSILPPNLTHRHTRRLEGLE